MLRTKHTGMDPGAAKVSGEVRSTSQGRKCVVLRIICLEGARRGYLIQCKAYGIRLRGPEPRGVSHKDCRWEESGD